MVNLRLKIVNLDFIDSGALHLDIVDVGFQAIVIAGGVCTNVDGEDVVTANSVRGTESTKNVASQNEVRSIYWITTTGTLWPNCIDRENAASSEE